MIINSLSSLTFRSTGTANKNDKMYIRTPKDYSAFIKKYEPILYEGDGGYAKLKEEISGTEYMRRRLEKHLLKQRQNADPIEGEVKVAVDDLKKVLADFRGIALKANAYFYSQILEEGLDHYAGTRKTTGLYEFKALDDSNETVILQHNQNKNYFRILINDKDNKPKRWYFFVDDFFVKDYDPLKGFDYGKSKYGNIDDIEAVRKPLLKDLAWIKESILKSCEFIKNNKTYQKALLKK